MLDVYKRQERERERERERVLVCLGIIQVKFLNSVFVFS